MVPMGAGLFAAQVMMPLFAEKSAAILPFYYRLNLTI